MPPFDPNDPVQTALQTAQQVRDTPTTALPDTNPMRRELSNNGLFSHAADVLANSKQNKGTWQQYRAALLKQGVKPDELKWSGADEKFQPNQMLTREQLKRHFDTALPKLHEKTYSDDDYDYADDTGTTGGPQYKDYTLPGGKNYREVLMHLPLGGRLPTFKEWWDKTHIAPAPTTPTSAQTSQYQKEAKNLHREDVYRSSHWQGVPNVVAHLRMSDRPLSAATKLTGYSVRNRASGNRSQLFKTEDEAKQYMKTLPTAMQSKLIVTPDEILHPDSKRKALHVEELQSDWAQEGREKGFKEPLTPEEHRKGEDYARRQNDLTPEERADWQALTEKHHRAQEGLPHGPYVDNTQKWVDLGLKRALHEAAKGGYDKLLITPGEEHAKRYDLSQQVRNVYLANPVWHGENGDDVRGHLIATGHNGSDILSQPVASKAEISNIIGQEAADRLINSPTSMQGRDHHLSGEGLRVGGEGMKSFYDRIVPQALEKLAKKHDPEARVQLHGHELPKSETKLHSLEITPKMRESILRGQSAFADGGAVAGNSVPGAVSTATDASDKGQLDKRANDLIGQIAANSKPSTDPGDDYAKGGKVHAAKIKRTTHRHPDGGVMHTYDEAGKASLSSRVKPVKSAPTSPSVDEALRIAAEATR